MFPTGDAIVLIQGGFDIAFRCDAATPMLLQVHLRPELRKRLKAPEAFRLDPPVPFHNYTDSFGNICTRLVAPAGILKLSNRFIIRHDGKPDVMPVKARQAKVEDLPDDVLVYLLGSRYCDTDKLATMAWRKFGKSETGWPLLKAILDYTHSRIKFGYEHARADRTASEGHAERRGVCRDYAHLAITLCRCMNIPARYCTGYLGDIGVPPDPSPMDFSGWFEAYLGGAWHTMDARHNKPRIGRLLMARGRDATDAAISTAFGNAELKQFDIITKESPA
jgi:transglutaminase-like putative cysteine protease